MTPDGPRAHRNEGVQISGGTQYGPVAGGPEAQATVHQAYPAGPSSAEPLPARQELLQAVAALRRDLAALIAERPGALEPDAAQDAEQSLAQAESEAGQAQPRQGRLRRRVQAVADALGDVGALAAGVSAVQTAFDRLFASG
ncbi:DUF5955 family protein [Streptomyces chrestomyceticus]|uniref:DUF5955 family protein n=1 Tax=Streptomyces chrestomyceticus TaxID=68185 RepID=UPI0037B1BB4A